MNDCIANSPNRLALEAPQRNRFFHGKLLTAHHLEMEQSYFNQKRWMINRLGLGTGVLCGLTLREEAGQVCVSAGAAVDGLGREILVPRAVCLDPWRPTDDCGRPGQPLSKDEDQRVNICLAYNECTADYAPALVTGCGTENASEAGTIVEGYHLLVRPGVAQPSPGTISEALCEALFSDADDQLPADRLNLLCRGLAGPCEAPADACIVLGSVQLNAGGTIGEIDSCTARPVVVSNAVLLEMILCLSERLDACCNQPTTPVQEAVRVSGVAFYNANRRLIRRLEDPKEVAEFSASQGVVAIRVSFTVDVDHGSIQAGGFGADPKTFSFLVQANWSRQTERYVPGILMPVNSTTTRFTIDPEFQAFREGEYQLTLFSSADPKSGRPPVMGANGLRLDGEPAGFPSGDDAEGGDFIIRFRVK